MEFGERAVAVSVEYSVSSDNHTSPSVAAALFGKGSDDMGPESAAVQLRAEQLFHIDVYLVYFACRSL